MTIGELYKALDAYCGVNVDRTEDAYKNLNKPIVVYSHCGPWDLGSVHEDSTGEVLVLNSNGVCKDIFTCSKHKDKEERDNYKTALRDIFKLSWSFPIGNEKVLWHRLSDINQIIKDTGVLDEPDIVDELPEP